MTNLRDLKLQQVIPPNLTQDEKVRHLAQSLDEIMRDVHVWADKLNYKLNLDDLPTEIIDHMLWEKHITWGEGLLLIENHQQKVELLKAAIELHRKKGTPYAIERVFSVLGLNAKLQEWFEYGSDPYHFKVIVHVTERGISQELLKNLETLISFYKNVRSVLEVIDIILRIRCPMNYAIGTTYGESLVVLPISKNQHITGETPLNYAIGASYGESMRIYPYSPEKIEQPLKYHAAITMQSGEKLTIYPKRGIENE